MGREMEHLKRLMERTDRVCIVGTGTDLSFSIKGMNAVPCAGELNIPDGEIFTAPIKDSVNGRITYNTPSLYQGRHSGGHFFRICGGENRVGDRQQPGEDKQDFGHR